MIGIESVNASWPLYFLSQAMIRLHRSIYLRAGTKACNVPLEENFLKLSSLDQLMWGTLMWKLAHPPHSQERAGSHHYTKALSRHTCHSLSPYHLEIVSFNYRQKKKQNKAKQKTRPKRKPFVIIKTCSSILIIFKLCRFLSPGSIRNIANSNSTIGTKLSVFSLGMV